MLERNTAKRWGLITEIVTQTRFDKTDKLGDLLAHTDYFQKQSLIASDHMYAITKALSPFSQTDAQTELLEGESFTRCFSEHTACLVEINFNSDIEQCALPSFRHPCA